MFGAEPTGIGDATAADRDAMYRICLLTGHRGRDASARHGDPNLLGDVYVGPYLAHSPECCLVISDPEGVCGYVVGTPDTNQFAQRLEEQWWPPLRGRLADRRRRTGSAWTTYDDDVARHVEQPPAARPPLLASHPAHAHIDLLPRAQGRGAGRALMAAFLERVAMAGAPGLHLGVDRDNERAVAFYRRLGFVTLADTPEDGLVLGVPTSPDPE